MAERNVDLQPAIDILTEMLATRENDYAQLKRQLPSFGAEVDQQLEIYHENLEHFVQGTVVWYYNSPRAYHVVVSTCGCRLTGCPGYFPPNGIEVPQDLVVDVRS